MSNFFADSSKCSKLESKLLELERVSPVSNDAELAKAIESIINAESELPEADRDYGLIDEAIQMMLALQGLDIDEVNAASRESFDRSFKRIIDESSDAQ